MLKVATRRGCRHRNDLEGSTQRLLDPSTAHAALRNHVPSAKCQHLASMSPPPLHSACAGQFNGRRALLITDVSCHRSLWTGLNDEVRFQHLAVPYLRKIR